MNANSPLYAAAQSLIDGFASLDLVNRLAEARRAIAGRLVFTTSFGLEDQAITHAILSQDLAIDVVTLDTGRLFPETYEVWARPSALWPAHSRILSGAARASKPSSREHGIDGFRASIAARQACCAVRKVEPLGRALDGASGWITGLRAEQSGDARDDALCGDRSGARPDQAQSAARLDARARHRFRAGARHSLQRAARSRLSSRSAARPARAPSSRASPSAPAAGGGSRKTRRNAACTAGHIGRPRPRSPRDRRD